jgi:3'-phosphoadenosine 5'-phosphosulfate sulfotransferase (PAPS reductase)/FAD synthetase
MIRHVVSVSGGKDSAATLLLALERFGRDRVTPIFCDTGNEHTAVYAYLSYLEQALDVQIVRLRANFDAEIAAKRMFIARDVRHGRQYRRVPRFNRDGTPMLGAPCESVDEDTGEITMVRHQIMGWDGGRKVRWTNKAKRRALAVLHPTGNAFLDLCLWKGRFPSRKAQFCTEELKRNLAVSFQLDLVDLGHTVVSWQGVRRDESLNRRNAKLFECIGPHLYAYRPLVDWTVADVFAYCDAHGIQPNPLYKQGMRRVGCMPCINCGKEELRQIAARFPEHLDEKRHWEWLVGQACKRGFSTFFNKELHAKDYADRVVHKANRIDAVIEWAKTSRGGRQFDLLVDLIEPTACSSAYGLCE